MTCDVDFGYNPATPRNLLDYIGADGFLYGGNLYVNQNIAPFNIDKALAVDGNSQSFWVLHPNRSLSLLSQILAPGSSIVVDHMAIQPVVTLPAGIPVPDASVSIPTSDNTGLDLPGFAFAYAEGNKVKIQEVNSAGFNNLWEYLDLPSSLFPPSDAGQPLVVRSLGEVWVSLTGDSRASLDSERMLLVVSRGKTRVATVVSVPKGAPLAQTSTLQLTPGQTQAVHTLGAGESWANTPTSLAYREGQTLTTWQDIQIAEDQPLNAQTIRGYTLGVYTPTTTGLMSQLYPGSVSAPVQIIRLPFQQHLGGINVALKYSAALSLFRLSDTAPVAPLLRDGCKKGGYKFLKASEVFFSPARIFSENPVTMPGFVGITPSVYWNWEETPPDLCPVRSTIPLDQGTRVDPGDQQVFFIVRNSDAVANNPSPSGYLHVSGRVQRDFNTDEVPPVEVSPGTGTDAIVKVALDKQRPSRVDSDIERVVMRLLRL